MDTESGSEDGENEDEFEGLYLEHEMDDADIFRKTEAPAGNAAADSAVMWHQNQGAESATYWSSSTSC
jgi:hypothetical protein